MTSPKLQRLPHIFDCAQSIGDNADIARFPEFKMADCKPEVHCIYRMELHITESAVSDVVRHRQTPENQ
jgi:hypothetical protein